jgi:predicted transcriptional regulator
VDGVIGFFLDNAARTSYAQINLRRMLDGHTVRDVMSTTCPMLPPQLTLDLLIDQYVLNGRGRCFAVGEKDHLLGLVTLHNVQRVSPADRPNTHLRDIVTPLEDLKVVSLGYSAVGRAAADGP